MKTALMWTINNFLTYRMVSGWSTNEKLAYPYYIENNKAFTLINYDIPHRKRASGAKALLVVLVANMLYVF